jgi:uncharacterized membrane protein
MSSLLSIELVFRVIGSILLLIVFLTIRDRGNPKRFTTALFWGLLACTFLFDKALEQLVGRDHAQEIFGLVVIAIALIAGFGGVGMGRHDFPLVPQRQETARRLGNRLFLPALAVPIVTVFGTIGLKGIAIGGLPLLDPNYLTLTSLAVAAAVALLLGWVITGGTPLAAVRESRRLIDAVGWAIVLPQMLAMLGSVFVVAKTGDAIRLLVTFMLPGDNVFLTVALYCVGMALFTMIMGNAFAAFPVMTAGVALPFLVRNHGADPAPLVAIGMYAGYCGTLMTPMAANFNLVPAALLELKDRYGVIKVQTPTALLLLGVNILLMYFLIFR